MKRSVVLCTLVFAVAVLATLFGCGSSNSGSSLTGSSSRVALYVTDSFREDFAHVWATIYHVEITPQSGSPVVLFDDPSGKQIDLKTLRDSSGTRFSFLGSATLPAGTYTGINVTIGSTMQLFQSGTAVGDPIPVDTSLPTDANGHPTLSLTFSTPKTIGSGTNTLIVDFDLAHFILRNSKVLPVIKEGDPAGCTDPNRHNGDEYHGTVTSLSGTAPDITFTITQGTGTALTVVTNASTALYGSGTLANGVTVEVRGTLDPTTGNLVATELEVPGTNAHTQEPSAYGTASNLDATAGTFILTITTAHGFTPSQTTVNIVVNSSTVFRGDGGTTQVQADFFTALTATPNVIVSGTYDAATNTLTATKAKVVDTSKIGGWEGGSHGFRSGVDKSNWGHGVFH